MVYTSALITFGTIVIAIGILAHFFFKKWSYGLLVSGAIIALIGSVFEGIQVEPIFFMIYAIALGIFLFISGLVKK